MGQCGKGHAPASMLAAQDSVAASLKDATSGPPSSPPNTQQHSARHWLRTCPGSAHSVAVCAATAFQRGFAAAAEKSGRTPSALVERPRRMCIRVRVVGRRMRQVAMPLGGASHPSWVPQPPVVQTRASARSASSSMLPLGSPAGRGRRRSAGSEHRLEAAGADPGGGESQAQATALSRLGISRPPSVAAHVKVSAT